MSDNYVYLLRHDTGKPYLLFEHPGGGEGYVFLFSAFGFEPVNG
jgi:hypothetical protein